MGCVVEPFEPAFRVAPAWRSRRVLVVGLARSGTAVARLLQRCGASVCATDAATTDDRQEEARSLRAQGIPVTLGEVSETLLDGVEYVVKNPGIRYDAPLIAAALRRGLPVVTEVEIAWPLARGPLIGITGSNGKTTTTTLVTEMLLASGMPAVSAGNIGVPLADAVQTVGSDTWIVAEFSSFQLQGSESLHPRIAALLNLYPAHLDYHGSFANYAAAKMKLFSNQTDADFAVVNGDQEDVRMRTPELKGRRCDVSLLHPVEAGVWLEDGVLRARLPRCDAAIVNVQDIRLRGRHNLQNAAFACAVALLAGASPEACAQVLATFGGVAHRLEAVAVKSGVAYYNDSKATNPRAAAASIEAFAQPLVVILGGLERGDDLAPLQSALAGRARAVVALGESAARMVDVARLAGVPTVWQADTLQAAVRTAARLARAGDVVLLSPAAASWDMFQSFEERGDIFKETVHML
ncbi:MAG: UDP-N-acetylmuramoyl-L-alanine--D-glutamate ligase [Firmicutes bacterium]|nr:UDP-N-acetylmuramoyl-L-alanine--D-glutamate ligase [Bacillota bacterium]